MIYSNRFAFIHLPRTGGHSVMNAIAQAGTTGVTICGKVWPLPYWLHGRAVDLVGMPGWDSSFRWAVTRNPWDVLESEWSFWAAQRRRHEETQGKCRLGHHIDDLFWERAIRQGKQTFEEYAREQYADLPAGGGRWLKWCMGASGEDIGVEPVRYGDLQTRWGELCRKMGIPTTPLARSNGFGRASGIDWTPSLLRWVDDHFADDISRFGYKPPA